MRPEEAMRRFFVCSCVLLVSACAPKVETTRETSSPSTAPTKELLYRQGHQQYVHQEFDSAIVVLKAAAALDSMYLDPLTDLALLHYELAMRGQSEAKKRDPARRSRDYYIMVDRLGKHESDVYERICELSILLDDDRNFLTYARKNAERYPFDRQYYNLGLAYINVGEYQNAIASQKEAIEKFTTSPFIGGFYRQLGKAYREIDRDQTAERTFDEGLGAVEKYVEQQKKRDAGFASSTDYKRLLEDKIGILVALRKLHATYKAMDKLDKVQKELKALGYDK